MRLLTKKAYEEYLNEVYGYGLFEICGTDYKGYYGTLLRRHDPIDFDESRWNHKQ